MTEETARTMIQAHFDASNVGAPGGGPGDDIARASEIYLTALKALHEEIAPARQPVKAGTEAAR